MNHQQRHPSKKQSDDGDDDNDHDSQQQQDNDDQSSKKRSNNMKINASIHNHEQVEVSSSVSTPWSHDLGDHENTNSTTNNNVTNTNSSNAPFSSADSSFGNGDSGCCATTTTIPTMTAISLTSPSTVHSNSISSPSFQNISNVFSRFTSPMIPHHQQRDYHPRRHHRHRPSNQADGSPKSNKKSTSYKNNSKAMEDMTVNGSMKSSSSTSSLERQLQVLISSLILSLIAFLYFVLPFFALVSLFIFGISSTLFALVAQSYIRHLFQTRQLSLYPLLPRFIQRFITTSLFDLMSTTTNDDISSTIQSNSHLLLYGIPGLTRQQRQEFIQRLPHSQRIIHTRPGALLHMFLSSDWIQFISPTIPATTQLHPQVEQQQGEHHQQRQRQRLHSISSSISSSLTSSSPMMIHNGLFIPSPIHEQHQQQQVTTTTTRHHRVMPVIRETGQEDNLNSLDNHVNCIVDDYDNNNNDLYLHEDEEDHLDERQQRLNIRSIPPALFSDHNSHLDNNSNTRDSIARSASASSTSSVITTSTTSNSSVNNYNNTPETILTDAFAIMRQTYSTIASESITQMSHVLVERVSAMIIPSGLYLSSFSLFGILITNRSSWIYNTLFGSSSSSTTTRQGEESRVGIQTYDTTTATTSNNNTSWNSLLIHGLYSGAILGGISAGTMWYIRNQFRSKVLNRNLLKELKKKRN